MEASDLLEIVSRDEDGKHQFKSNVSNADSLAAEMVAFSNSGGGQIIIGVNNEGSIAGLERGDIGRLNQLISNAASQGVHPPINPSTENVRLSGGLVVVVTVQDGISKPYMDNSGAIWVKSGADKRKVTSREEIQRMFQRSGIVYGDETLANGLTTADIDLEAFRKFYEESFGETIEKTGLPLPRLLENMNLAESGTLRIAGALLFARAPYLRLPSFIVKAVAFPGTSIADEAYLDSKDIVGRIADLFQRSIGFISTNIRSVQGERGVNSIGSGEIPRIVLEELLSNALIHRDYFISAPIRVLVFLDRIEIISPGNLPNNLTIENIVSGNSNIRNPIIASFATRILPYRGLGSGIRRALREYPSIDFRDDRDGNLFIATIRRK